jgi:hypothetical protein
MMKEIDERLMCLIYQWEEPLFQHHPNTGVIYNTGKYYLPNVISSDLASNEQAWQETRDLPEMTDLHFPYDAMIWGTAATRNATTWPHIDDHGMATIVKVMTGKKYWVVMRPKRDQSQQSSNGDMDSIRAFPEGWSPSTSCHTVWDHEGVLLQAGDTLYVMFHSFHFTIWYGFTNKTGTCALILCTTYSPSTILSHMVVISSPADQCKQLHLALCIHLS